jgi:hypothetical protein
MNANEKKKIKFAKERFIRKNKKYTKLTIAEME